MSDLKLPHVPLTMRPGLKTNHPLVRIAGGTLETSGQTEDLFPRWFFSC